MASAISCRTSSSMWSRTVRNRGSSMGSSEEDPDGPPIRTMIPAACRRPARSAMERTGRRRGSQRHPPRSRRRRSAWSDQAHTRKGVRPPVRHRPFGASPIRRRSTGPVQGRDTGPNRKPSATAPKAPAAGASVRTRQPPANAGPRAGGAPRQHRSRRGLDRRPPGG